MARSLSPAAPHLHFNHIQTNMAFFPLGSNYHRLGGDEADDLSDALVSSRRVVPLSHCGRQKDIGHILK